MLYADAAMPCWRYALRRAAAICCRAAVYAVTLCYAVSALLLMPLTSCLIRYADAISMLPRLPPLFRHCHRLL